MTWKEERSWWCWSKFFISLFLFSFTRGTGSKKHFIGKCAREPCILFRNCHFFYLNVHGNLVKLKLGPFKFQICYSLSCVVFHWLWIIVSGLTINLQPGCPWFSNYMKLRLPLFHLISTHGLKIHNFALNYVSQLFIQSNLHNTVQ